MTNAYPKGASSKRPFSSPTEAHPGSSEMPSTLHISPVIINLRVKPVEYYMG